MATLFLCEFLIRYKKYDKNFADRDKKSQLVIIMVSEISKNAATNFINIDDTVQGSTV